MIRCAGYGVVAEKPRVGHLARNFPCTMYYYYYRSTDYSDASLKLQGHLTYQIFKKDGRQ